MLDALNRSVSAQRQLVADASHELRTPLASARANLEVVELHDSLPADERRRIVADALEELREMTLLIEELVELARGDAHSPDKRPTRLDHLTEEVLAGAIRRSATTFRADLDPTLVDAAPAAVTRAISNLLDNAVKWSPEGEPVDVTVRDGSVVVRDRGPGIDPADLPHVFDRFYRAAGARKLPGSGLGLAIVRQVAETHGGTVAAEPADGGGSVFTFRLPVVADTPKTPWTASESVPV
jgi:two-component system sensor histidine kinase MprB